jgi:methylated-DNA-[protein]-cysteine S-methyltransferase
MGKVTTYACLARSIDCGSSQAVGQALKRNPFAPQVPCHRVIKSDRSLGGFSGQSEGPEVARKRRLLIAEGVSFDSQGRVRSSDILSL